MGQTKPLPGLDTLERGPNRSPTQKGRPVSFFLSTRWGGDERESTLARMHQVLTELDADDIEHPGVSLTHESGWSLGAFPGGLLTWENVGADDEPRHMNGVARGRVLELWAKLADGWIAEVDAEPWLPGSEDPA